MRWPKGRGQKAPTGKGDRPKALFHTPPPDCGKVKKSGALCGAKSLTTPVFLCMAWLRPHQVRELVREVLGWEMHPNTLYAWGRSGKIRRLVPGGGRIFYASEDVAAMLGLTHDEVLTIVQKEKGGRP
jgi:hypothetical protein